MIDCKYHDGVRCALGFYGGRPSPGVCAHCLGTGQKGDGLGDTVSKAVHIVTRGRVKGCRGCRRRQRKLNELAPRKTV